MKSSGRRKVLLVIVTTALATLWFLAHRWYYENVRWPREIQMNIFGRVVASHDDLISREGFSHLGQGAYRWDYRIQRGNASVQSLCGARSIETCNWTRRAQPYAHVTQDAIFKNGILTLEESWE
jgi:hypothetical protein